MRSRPATLRSPTFASRLSALAHATRAALGVGVLTLGLGTPAAWAASAEIVMLQGKGERRAENTNLWRAAAINQKLDEGEFVRTLADSQMAIYMPDRTQVRLQPNSQLQVKTISPLAAWSESLLRLVSGRAWSQARPQSGAESAQLRRSRVTIQTPTVTMGIRGTDWDVEVAPDGRTQLVVLSGVVSMSNEHGSVEVAAGESAVAEQGKAPVKRTLMNARERVQWVSSWRPQPRRWAGDDQQRLSSWISRIESGDFSASAQALRAGAVADTGQALLLADLLIYQGDAAAAAQALHSHARDGAGDPRAVELLALALTRQDQLDAAQALLSKALSARPGNVGLLLASGELAALSGDAALAQSAFAQAAAAQPTSARALFGLGLVDSERENVRAARALLGQALALEPGLHAARAELAATESFAGNLEAARALLSDVLSKEPDNYQALTALGLAKLKAGQAEQALEDFLKAGVIEPRYARAWLYQAVAFYQQGQVDRARQALGKAAELDPRDPMPHMYLSVIAADALQFGAAIGAARAAQARMPYLRSLNQAASNQKGSANVGAALAQFGMEEWARHYANEAYSPYWGGSHLFLADRHTGKFAKNSELMSGYLTEPLAFGASNRHSSLIAQPGHYARMEAVLDRSDWNQAATAVTLNGLGGGDVPVAYYLRGDFAAAHARPDASKAHGRNFTLGLGAKPQHDLGLFAFATDTQLAAHLRTPSLPSDPMTQSERRADIGVNFKWSAQNQWWFKLGSGKQENSVQGAMVSASTADALNRAFSTNVFQPTGTLNGFGSAVRQEDAQVRHSFNHGAHQWTWGLEHSRQRRTGQLSSSFAPARIDIDQQLDVKLDDAYVGWRGPFGPLLLGQIDLFAQRMASNRSETNTLSLQTGTPQVFPVLNAVQREDASELNPRVGLRFQLAPAQTLSVALQRWRRSASAGSLAPVDTAGIAVNDRLVSAGGRYQRARMQYDAEISSKHFLHAFVDRESVDNGLSGMRSAITDFEVSQLEALKNRPEVFAARSDIEETPQFAQGRVRTLGLAYNGLLAPTHSLALRYLWRDAEQTGANQGLAVPYLPRQQFTVAGQWALDQRLLVGSSATYRSKRFKDEANLEALAAGWSLGLSLYWESADKRHSVQALLDNILSNKAAGVRPDAHLMLRYAYNY